MNEEDYEEEIEHIASLFMQKVQKMKEEQYSKKLFPQLRRLKTPTDKLVYQFIMFTGPSSYTHIKKGLNLGSHGLSDSLNRMKELGVIFQIEDDRYELTTRKRINEELEEYKEKVEFLKKVLWESGLGEVKIPPKIFKDIEQHVKEHPELGYANSFDFAYDAVIEKVMKDKKKG